MISTGVFAAVIDALQVKLDDNGLHRLGTVVRGRGSASVPRAARRG